VRCVVALIADDYERRVVALDGVLQDGYGGARPASFEHHWSRCRALPQACLLHWWSFLSRRWWPASFSAVPAAGLRVWVPPSVS